MDLGEITRLRAVMQTLSRKISSSRALGEDSRIFTPKAMSWLNTG